MSLYLFIIVSVFSSAFLFLDERYFHFNLLILCIFLLEKKE